MSSKYTLRIDPESGAAKVRSKQQRDVLLCIYRYNKEGVSATVRQIECSEPLDEHAIRGAVLVLKHNGLLQSADGSGAGYTLSEAGRRAVQWVLDNPDKVRTCVRSAENRYDPHKWDGETDAFIITAARVVVALDEGRDDDAREILRTELARFGLDDVDRALALVRGELR